MDAIAARGIRFDKAHTCQRENEEYEPRQLDYATGLEITEAVRNK